MIRFMEITSVQMDEDFGQAFTVEADTLEMYYPNEDISALGEFEFFELACLYLEDYVDGVESTEHAKIDYYG